MKKYTLLLVVILCSNLMLNAQTWTGATDTDWTKGSNWNGGAAPTTSGNVIIPGAPANQPRLPSATILNSLTMQAGSKLDVNGFTLTTVNSISITSATVENSGATTISMEAGGGNLSIRGSTIETQANFKVSGTTILNEADLTGPNRFKGNVTFTLAGSGNANLSSGFRSTFEGNLNVVRTVAGLSNLFTTTAAASTAVEGNFYYINKVGGNTIIGNIAQETRIKGELWIETESITSNPSLAIRSLTNEMTGGWIIIKNPGALDIRKNKLKLINFTVLEKRTGVSDFDENELTVSSGVSYADAGAVGETPANANVAYFSRNVINGPTTFESNGSGDFYEAWSGRGANTFNGDVSFLANGSGSLYLSYYYKSSFNGNLSVRRTASGLTDIFNSAGTGSITGDFSYTNKVGGSFYMGRGAGKITIGGKILVDVESMGTHPGFLLQRLDNSAGNDQGNIVVKNPGVLDIKENKLKLHYFLVTGKRTGVSDFDENEITVPLGLTYTDAGAVGETPANANVAYFSRNVINGPTTFESNGSGDFYETWSGRGANTFNGDVSFLANGSGALYLSYYYKSSFDGNLSVRRTASGVTDIFNSAGAGSITGDFSYTNKAGGSFYMGRGTGKITIGGKILVDVESMGTHPSFVLQRLDNSEGNDQGNIVVKNPGVLDIKENKLKINYFVVTGKRTGVSDFDENEITVPLGLTYTDAGAVGETPANANVAYFSRNVINGPATFESNGSGDFYDTWSGRGPNQFNGDVSYTRNGTGTIYVGAYYVSSYAGNLSFTTAEGYLVAASRIRFNGNTNASFSHAGVSEPILPGFILEKEAGASLVLTQPLRVNGVVDFISGYVTSSAINPLVFQSAASYISAGDNSHVVGPVLKTGNTAFTFPVGNGSVYHPAAISAPTGGSHTFSAEYRAADFENYDPENFEAPLEKVSNQGYWDVKRLSGTNGVYLTLSYKATSGAITEPTDLRVAHWSGSWKSLGGSVEGDNTAGTVQTQNLVTDFSPFAISTINSDDNPLPVKLAEFSAIKEGNTAVLNWTTTTETGAGFFEIQYSLNASIWNSAGAIPAKGYSQVPVKYSHQHILLPGQTHYYRLKIVDIDGSFEYSDIRSLAGEKNTSSIVTVYPNPTSDFIRIASTHKAEIRFVEISDAQGIKRQQASLGQTDKLNIRGLTPGIYFLRINYDDNTQAITRFLISR